MFTRDSAFYIAYWQQIVVTGVDGQFDWAVLQVGGWAWNIQARIGNEARLKGLEKVMEKWHAEDLAERDYAEQIALEEAVNNILACKRC